MIKLAAGQLGRPARDHAVGQPQRPPCALPQPLLAPSGTACSCPHLIYSSCGCSRQSHWSLCVTQVLSNETNLLMNGTNEMIILGGMDDMSVFSSERPAIAIPCLKLRLAQRFQSSPALASRLGRPPQSKCGPTRPSTSSTRACLTCPCRARASPASSATASSTWCVFPSRFRCFRLASTRPARPAVTFVHCVLMG